MKYSEEQENEFKRVLDVFASYLDNTNYMELFKGQKSGYFFIETNPDQTRITVVPKLIESPVEIVDKILSYIVIDVLVDSGNFHDLCEATLEEREEIHRRIEKYVELLPEYRDLAEKIMNEE